VSFLIIAFNLSFHFKRREEGKDSEEKAINIQVAPSNAGFEDVSQRLTGDQELSSETAREVPVTDNAGGIDFEIAEHENENGGEKEGIPDGIEYGSLDSQYDPLLDLRDYKYPPIDLLNDYGESNTGVRKEELEANKDRIVNTLNNYDISIDKIKATIGPAVTLYEIIPSPGVRIARIKNLEDDIALSLSALGIRIIAPLPGKGTIGIEVPNQNPEIVSIKSILSSERFQNTKYALPFGLGKTISNESYIADLTKMPHILMAGATGQGKSVGLNAIITSLLYKKHPSQLKFVLVDPKKVELSLFSKIDRHFLAKLPDLEDSILTDIRQVVRTLYSLNIEMDSRYDLLRDAQVRNVQEYNAKFISRKLNPLEGHRYLPFIVVVVDEFADLIMTAGKEVEIPLTRLAQLSRAIGIHMIIATQRPSVNIITGLIKANFPTRIAFRVISKIDSRTILDANGAEQLIGRGDMLIGTGNDLVRLQCAFVDIEEVERVSEYIGSQRGYPTAFNLPEYFDERDEPNKDFDPNERDELFEDGARLVVQYQHGSTSLLQRKLKLGYNRAGRIIDQLEAAGIVGPFEGSKAREVKVKTEMELEQYLRDFEQPKNQK
jgi:S-DNA-T family DNA segregation ATPase FtsK/SpoIIIE